MGDEEAAKIGAFRVFAIGVASAVAVMLGKRGGRWMRAKRDGMCDADRVAVVSVALGTIGTGLVLLTASLWWVYENDPGLNTIISVATWTVLPLAFSWWFVSSAARGRRDGREAGLPPVPDGTLPWLLLFGTAAAALVVAMAWFGWTVVPNDAYVSLLDSLPGDLRWPAFALFFVAGMSPGIVRGILSGKYGRGKGEASE